MKNETFSKVEHAFAALIRKEQAQYAQIIQRAGIRAE